MTGSGFRRELPEEATPRPSSQPLDRPATQQASPLVVILGGTGHGTVAPGTAVDLSVTVTNKGHASAIVDIFLDDLPSALYPWVSSTQERLALGTNQTDEVIFQIQVPATAPTGHYLYALVVDAPQHYPDSPPQRFEQQLQVLPALREVDQVNDPTFFLLPATRAASPASLLPGETLDVQVLVHNRGPRVDRFRLRCRDLPSEWLTVTYPQGFQQPGLSVLEQYLDLNPGEQDTIEVQVTVPLNTLAGSYVGTLQIQSDNQPDLALLDLLYLKVLPVYQINLNFRTLVSRIQQEPGVFMVQASNQGNTPRQLLFQVLPLDGGNLCNYTLESEQLHLEAFQTQTVRLLVQPQDPRKRPWTGGGKIINFALEAQDEENLPLPEIPMQGFIIWEARPWWQLLPLVLLGFISLASFVGLIWWWLIRPPAPPQVVRLKPADAEYTAANDDAIRLDFQVTHPARIQTLEIVGQSPEGKITSRPVTYDLSQGLPVNLQPFCTLTRQLLSCRNLLTDARQPGEYQFTLTVFPRPGRGNLPTSSLTSPVMAIAPLPQPAILSFNSTQPVYPEPPPPPPEAEAAPTPPAKAQPIADPYGIRLNWQIAHPERIAAIQLVGFDPEGAIVFPAVVLDFQNGLPEELAADCTLADTLTCENLQTGIVQSGSYRFELTVIPVDDATAAPIAQTTPPIRIQARPPQILSFLVNGEPMQAQHIVRLLPNQPPPPFVVSWKVEPNPGTLVSLLPVPGDVPWQGSLPIPLSPEAASTTITLQVTNSAGTQIKRSFTLQTLLSAANEEAGNGAPEAVSVPEESLTTPRPSQPNTLAPAELPPQFE